MEKLYSNNFFFFDFVLIIILITEIEKNSINITEINFEKPFLGFISQETKNCYL